MKNIREIIQICETMESESGIPSLTVLTNDCRVWRLINDKHWKLLPQIPQIDEPEEEEPEEEEYPDSDIEPEDTDVL